MEQTQPPTGFPMAEVVRLGEDDHAKVRMPHRSLEAAQAEQLTGVSDEQWWRVRAPTLGSLVDFSQFPTASRVGTAAGEAYNSAYNAQEAFEFGLQRVLDGIEALVAGRSAGT